MIEAPAADPTPITYSLGADTIKTTVFDPFLVKNQEDVSLTSCQTLVYSVTTSPDDLESFVSLFQKLSF